MPSPFSPAMDPHLEGHLWPDFHHGLATEIRRRLCPLLKPRYVARLEIYLVEDETPEAEIGILYPDVEFLTRQRTPGGPAPIEGSPATAAPLTLPILSAVSVRISSIEIRDAARNELVTTIEILSPVNKREPGVTRYRERRDRLHRSGVHLLEIDLLRRGTRPLSSHPRLPACAYLITLTRSPAQVTEAWPLRLPDRLPCVPVPLRAPDPDVPLDLAPAVDSVYDEAAYDLSVDYAQPPPPPPLAPPEEASRREALARARRGG
jgi:hypothetical protein